MQFVKLKNGESELSILVKTTMLSLKTLIESDPISFYELAEKAKNHNHKFFWQYPLKA